jgi:hypothetical protein
MVCESRSSKVQESLASMSTIGDDGRVSFELVAEPPANAAEDETRAPLWKVTIRGFDTDRIVARWFVRRHVGRSMAQLGGQTAFEEGCPVGRPTAQLGGQTAFEEGRLVGSRAPLGGSECAILVARGHGDGWHRVPSEHPLGSSEWLARRSSHPPELGPAAANPALSDPDLEHLGASESWRRSPHAHALEDQFASERHGRCWTALDGVGVCAASSPEIP